MKRFPDPEVDFVIGGVQKGGTSALQSTIKKHPEIYIPGREIHFFNSIDNYDKGIDWYLNHFLHKKKFTGDKTPNYFHHKHAIERVYEYNPNMKWIISLRDPVTRAWSAFKMRERNGRNLHLGLKGALRYGHYAMFLEILYGLFDKEQVLLTIWEHNITSPNAYARQCCQFIGADPDKCPRSVPVKRLTNPSDIPEEDRQMMLEYYAEHNERLFDMLGHRIKEWQYV
jgi:hypothetical protein